MHRTLVVVTLNIPLPEARTTLDRDMRRKSISNISKYSGLTLLFLGVVITNDAAAGGHQLDQRFGDSAVQGFSSRMNDSAIQRFDSRMRNSMVQRFESRMLRSPVQDFNSQMLNSGIQGFDSQMMYSPAQRVEGPWKSLRLFRSSFYPISRLVPGPAQEAETSGDVLSRSVARPQFISQHCGAFVEMTVGESEMLSEKEDVPCTTAE